METKILGQPCSKYFKKYDDSTVYINRTRKKICDVKCRDFYWHFVSRRSSSPTCTVKWEQIYENYIFDWESIYHCAFICARETALQSFQYKVINRFLPCNALLYKWNKSDTDLCNDCQTTDSIEHFLVQCSHLENFWMSFFTWWKTVYDVLINVKTLDIIFGINNTEHDIVLNSLNFCILYAKYFIYKCKINSIGISFHHFKNELKNRIEYEKCILIKENKLDVYVEQWQAVFNSL